MYIYIYKEDNDIPPPPVGWSDFVEKKYAKFLQDPNSKIS